MNNKKSKNGDNIPFSRPYKTGEELRYITEAHSNGALAGNGTFTKQCQDWLKEYSDCNTALLTHSCTAALEMSALLLDIQPGDEIIIPSFTFVSTANAFALRGGVAVFVDIRADTLNINEQLIEAAITPKTKAIAPVHYGGIACELDTILDIARRHKLMVIADAAHGVMAYYQGRALGSIGDLGTFSFHATKNIISGEGGALLVNNPELTEPALIIREKGTDRSRFFRGEIDKYTWQRIGSSFLPGELIAAFLWAQLEEAKIITQRRLESWDFYHSALESLEKEGFIQRPIVPKDCQHNAHIYYVLLAPDMNCQAVVSKLNQDGINVMRHYFPLHSSPGGKAYGRVHESMAITDKQTERLVRLPLWLGLTTAQQTRVVESLTFTVKNS